MLYKYKMAGSIRTAVVGASGYAGAELLRLAAGHPDLDVAYLAAGTRAGEQVGSLYPSLEPAYPATTMESFDPDHVAGFDLVFFAMPHGAAMELVPEVLPKVGRVVDLSADFRLTDPTAYPRWYGEPHTHPELLAEAVLGIPEIYRDKIKEARLVAAAGCYVTAAALGLAPLVRSGIIERRGVIVDAASGISGAGGSPSATTHFSSANENFCAYGLLTHRHTPEIEQASGAQVLFTPHLAPMTRGILATCYARPRSGETTESVLGALRDTYAGEQFVRVCDDSPSTKSTFASNSALLSARVDARTGWVIVLSALDNLVKGAAGQAIQCANITLGLDEESGLSAVGVYP